MPKAHRAHLEWSPSRLIGWGATIGRHTEALVHALLESRPPAHVEPHARVAPFGVDVAITREWPA
jgi:hypothetical protein